MKVNAIGETGVSAALASPSRSAVGPLESGKLLISIQIEVKITCGANVAIICP